MIDRIVKFLAYISSGATLLITIIVFIEVCYRGFFNKSIMVADEYSAYLYVVLVLFGLGYTLKEKGHIRIRIILSRLSDKNQKYLDLVVSIIALFICGFAFYYSILLVKDSYRLAMVSETPAKTPIWIPQLAMPVGFFVFGLQIGKRVYEIIHRRR